MSNFVEITRPKGLTFVFLSAQPSFEQVAKFLENYVKDVVNSYFVGPDGKNKDSQKQKAKTV